MRRSGKINVMRKAKILDKARVLFWEKGYSKTSVKDIARACGFEAGNIYNYFSSKESIVYEIIKEEAESLVSSIKLIENDNAANPVEKLHSVIKAHYKLALGPKRVSGSLFDSENRHLLPNHLKTIIGLRNAYENSLRNIIRKGIDSGCFTDLDDTLVAYAIAAIIIRTRIWFSPKGRLSIDEIADFTIDFVLNGLICNKSGKNSLHTIRNK